MKSGKFKIVKRRNDSTDKVKFNINKIRTVYADVGLVDITFEDETRLTLQGDIQSFVDLISSNVNRV